MRTVPTILLLLAMPATAAAQGAGVGLHRHYDPLPPAPALEIPAGDAPAGLAERLLRAVGGAAVGAWVGYMASQVAVGDWDDDTSLDRGSWAAGGAALGITIGLSIPGVDRPARRAGTRRSADRAYDRNLLSTEQIRSAQAGSMYDVIRSLRPEWLRTRGTGSMRETTGGTASGTDVVEISVQQGIPTIRVYLDESLLGDLDALRSVDPGMIGEARFLGPAQATQRWGSGHIHGAIVISTASAR